MSRTVLRLALLLAGLAGAAGAPAAVTSVAVSPASERVAPGRAAALAITWQVTTNAVGVVTVSSAAGQFLAPGGTVLGAVQAALSKSATGPGAVAFSETVTVPAGVLERARRDGHGQVFYRRSFSDGAAASGELVLRLASESAAAFALSRLALGFDEGEPVRVIGRGQELRARAEASHTGTGVLRGTWEVAGPQPDPRAPAWRVLSEVTQPLARGESALIVSPPLPADVSGLYLVRLRVQAPETAFDPPVVRYFVGQE